MNTPRELPPRLFGATGLRQPALGFGCMGLVGWYGERDDAEARVTLEEALERGLVHFDTAASYQNGANERFVGAALASRRRNLFLATKYGITRDGTGNLVIDNAPASLRSACDTSLANLGTDYIDLYYLHRIDRRVPIEESVGELGRLVKAGKIRHIGLSECSVETLRRAHAVHPVSAVQSEYSLWSRDPEDGMLAACRELNVAFVAYSPLGRGFLAGNFRSVEELPPEDARRNQPRFTGENGTHNLRLAESLRAFAERLGCSAPQLALAWVLAQGEHVFAIPGMKRRSHLDDNLGALRLHLGAAELAELAALFEHLEPRGERHPPAMMQAIDR
jgi:aryl-alcohol dehydrogenase-like predicted oxidoreductase